MKNNGLSITNLISCLLFIGLLSGCMTSKSTTPEETSKHLGAIALLPVDARLLNGEVTNGNTILDQVLNAYVQDNNIKGIKTVSQEQQDTMRIKFNQPRLEEAISLGRELKVQGVLITNLTRFHERGGKEYSVTTPASIAFDYRLLEIESGETLCTGSFDETQQSFSENVLSLGKIWKRGGKWITAAELAREGVEESFKECQYLTP